MSSALDSIAGGIAGAKPMGSRGNWFRLGTHIVELYGFKIEKQARGGSNYCAVECKVVETLAPGSYGGNLTPEEIGRQCDPYGSDEPHHAGEMCTAIYKQATDADMFQQNAKGALVAMKNAAHNYITAATQLYITGADSDADRAEGESFVKDFKDNLTALGIDLDPAKRNDFSPQEIVAAADPQGAQPFRGMYIVADVRRIKTKTKGICMNAVTFQAATVAQIAKILSNAE